MAIYKPLEVSTIPTVLYNLRSESSSGFELLTEFMLTDVVEETMRLGVDNGHCSWTWILTNNDGQSTAAWFNKNCASCLSVDLHRGLGLDSNAWRRPCVDGSWLQIIRTKKQLTICDMRWFLSPNQVFIPLVLIFPWLKCAITVMHYRDLWTKCWKCDVNGTLQ